MSDQKPEAILTISPQGIKIRTPDGAELTTNATRTTMRGIDQKASGTGEIAHRATESLVQTDNAMTATSGGKILNESSNLIQTGNAMVADSGGEILNRTQPTETTTFQSQAAPAYAPDKLKIFISHRDTKKVEAKQLATSLEGYGISCFVAHDSIVPMTLWKHEILKALHQMDAFVCFITDDFYTSEWTNQEIGYALAKDVPIYLFSHDGTDPCGFKLDTQAIKTGSITLIDCIKRDFVKHLAVKQAMLTAFTEAVRFQDAKDKFIDLLGLSFSDDEIDGIVQAISAPNGMSGRINQLKVILMDQLEERHRQRMRLEPIQRYYELLNSKIFSQHTQNRYKAEWDAQVGTAQIIDRFSKI